MKKLKSRYTGGVGFRLGISSLHLIYKSLEETNVDSFLTKKIKSYITLMQKVDYVSTEKEKEMTELVFNKKEKILKSLKLTQKSGKSPYIFYLVDNLVDNFQDLINGRLDFIHLD